MKEHILLLAIVIGFSATTGFVLLESHKTFNAIQKINSAATREFRDRDKKMFRLNNRLIRLEDQRNLEQRLTEVEKQLRTYCVGDKIDMCAQLQEIKR